MNREIKFRIWDKISKTLIYDNLSLFWFHIPRAINGQDEIEGESNLISLSEILAHPDFVAQQYTRLQDCNGNDIYEGDIVKYARIKVESTEFAKGCFSSKAIEIGEEIGEIIFIMPSFCISFEHIRYDDIMPMPLAEHRYEVIGNVFETPELIKKP